MCWPWPYPDKGLGGAGCPGSHSPRPACSPLVPILPEFVALRLENSDGCSGRLQVFYNGTWGSICSNSMTLDTVSLACKELGCGDGGTLETQLPYGRVSGPTWLDYVQCGEKNSSFWQCPSAPWNPRSCEDLREETHITCTGNSEPPGHPSVTTAPVACWVWPNVEKELGGAFPFHVSPFCCWWQKSDHSHTHPAAVATQVASSTWGRQRHLQVRSQKRPDRVQKSLPSIDMFLLLC